MKKLTDITGKKYGQLTVIKYYGFIKNGNQRQSAWICKCDCGKEKIISNSNLKSGSTISCGCSRRKANTIDLIGQKIKMLEVIKWLGSENKSSIWLCKCDCGKECCISANALRAGQKSCGCQQGWHRAEKRGLWKNSAKYAKWKRNSNSLLRLKESISGSIRTMLSKQRKYKRKKSIRNYLPYTIDELKSHLESLWEPWMNWNNYGGKPNDPKRTWHIDHIIPHSSFPYKSMKDPLFLECWKLSNLQPLEKIKNMSKGAKMPVDKSTGTI